MMIEIPYGALTLKEVIFLLKQHEGYFDGDKQAVIIED